jgi:YcxB-like protein
VTVSSKRDNPPVLTLKFTLTRPEVAKILRQRMVRRWQNWAFLVGAVIILVCGILLSNVVLITMGVLYVLWCVVFDTVGLPWIYWRRFENLHSEHTMTISDDGIASERAQSSSQTEWAFWSRVQALPDAYLIIAGRQSMLMIPKRVFTSSDDEYLFQAIVSRHLPTSSAPAT